MDKKLSADYWIKRLNLTEHPEGGAFSEIYRSPLTWEPSENHPIKEQRSLATSIYFLLKSGQFSAFHRIKSDELWHHYVGDDIIIYEITTDGKYHEHLLGKNHPNALPQACIKAESWFASRVYGDGNFGLAGCTVSPGFDFNDFELAQKDELLSKYPEFSDVIVKMTL